MPTNTAEYGSRRDVEEYPAIPLVEKAMDHIAETDPELMLLIMEHKHEGIHHSAAAWTVEQTTLSYDRDGAAVEVMNQDSAAFRIFEAVRHTGLGEDPKESVEAALEIVDMMTTPYAEAVEDLPPGLEPLKDRLVQTLEDSRDATAWNLAQDAAAKSRSGWNFCERTESFTGLSRDLERAEEGEPDFDTVLMQREPELWEELREAGHRPPDVLPVDGARNPRGEKLLEAYRETVPGWSWDYQENVRRGIAEGVTAPTKERLNAQEEALRETGRFQEARDIAQLIHETEVAEATLAGALLEVTRRGGEARGAEHFHDALARIAESELHPENVLASGY